MIVRRLVLVFSIALCGSLALAAGAYAAGGGFGPGKMSFSSTAANATVGKSGPAGPYLNVSVNQGYNSFQPTHPHGPRTVMYSTMVFYSDFNPATGVGGSGCFVVPASDFTVARGLQSASLHTTLTADEQCPGFGTPVGKGGAGFAGGGGGGGGAGLTLPITVDVTWTGNGAITKYSDRFSLSCLGYAQDGTNVSSDSAGGATITTSDLGQLAADFADVSSSDGTLDISGSPQPSCFGY
jgi:hypothetical protein